MRHNRHITLTSIIVYCIIFLYILCVIGITHSAYRRRKKLIAKCTTQRKELPISKILSLRNDEYQNFKKCAELRQFLFKINTSEHIICIYVAQLPGRLHGGAREGERDDGEAVFPELIVAHQTQEGLRIEVPDRLRQPNNYRAIRVAIRTEVARETEAVHGSGTTDSRHDDNSSNSINNEDDMAACAPARPADVTENAPSTSCHQNGSRRPQCIPGDTIAVKVHHQGTYITFNVPRGTLIEAFTHSEEFINRVTIEWNITERDLQGMVLRNRNQFVITFETDCNIRLVSGYIELFLN